MDTRIIDRAGTSVGARPEAPRFAATGAEQGGDAAGTPGGTLLPAFLAGVLAGIVMAAWMIVAAAVSDHPPLSQLWPLADTFLGTAARDRGAGALAYGLVLHLTVSGAVGVLFTSVLPRDFPRGGAALMCTGFSFVALGFTSSLILPAINPGMRETMRELGGAWVLAHAAYGTTLGFTAQALRQRTAGHSPAWVRESAPSIEPGRSHGSLSSPVRSGHGE